MAGTFTHFTACSSAISNRSALPADLRQLLNRHSEFLYLGAVSPDLPYLSFKTGGVNWADVMHYEKTNAIAVYGHDALKKVWATKGIKEETQLVWLLGFVSHLVIDATIHPIVQAIVGPYAENKEAHRICEMTQDSLIFFEIKKMEVRYSEFSDILKYCRESPHIEDLIGFWTEQTVKAHAEKHEEPSPGLWLETYSDAIDVAEGGSGVVALFRHLETVREYTYSTREDIAANAPDRLKRFYTDIKLPDGGMGSFRELGFNRAVANVTTAWNAFYNGLTSDVVVANVTRNWNLDTGVDMGTRDGTVTYWPKA